MRNLKAFFASSKVLVKELKNLLLYSEPTGVRHVPEFGGKERVCMLAVPYIMHLRKSLLDTGDREKMVKGATNKERRMRTSQGGDVRIVEVLTECRNAVGKTSVLLSSITQGKLIVGSDHPADVGTRLDLVGKGSKHP